MQMLQQQSSSIHQLTPGRHAVARAAHSVVGGQRGAAWSPKLQRPLRRLVEQPDNQQLVPPLPLPALPPEVQQQLARHRRHQQQHSPPTQLLPHPMCTLDPAALTHAIKQCHSWRAAAVLFAQQAPCLNHISAAALLVQLARLPGQHGDAPPQQQQRPANWAALLRQVLAVSQPLLQQAQARQLATMAWALAKLGFTEWVVVPGGITTQAAAGACGDDCDDSDSEGSSGSWGREWQRHVLRCLPQASCRDVANILWALAACSSAASAVPANEGRAMHSHHGATPQQGSSTQLLGPGSPSDPQQQLLLVALQRSRLAQELLSALHRTLPSSTPQDVSNAVWALATLQLRPPPELLQFLLVRGQAAFPSLLPQEVALLLWALGRLQAAPPAAWLTECLQRQVGRPAWRRTRPQHYVMALVACAQLQQVPPTPWIVECLEQLQVLLLEPLTAPEPQQHQHPQQEQHSQHAEAIAAVRSSVAAALHGLGGSTSACEYGALGPTSIEASSTSTSSGIQQPQLQQQAQQQQPQPQHHQQAPCGRPSQDLANALWALARLRVKPNEAWMQHYLAASAASLAAAKPQELANTLWGLARLRVVPGAAWLAAFDAASLAAMDGFTPQGLADVLAAQVHLGQRPSGVWAEAWVAAVKRRWGGADAAAVCKILWAAAKCQLPLGRAWLDQALAAAHAGPLRAALAAQPGAEGGLSCEELLRLMWAVGRLCRGMLSQGTSDVLGLHACRAAGRFSGAQLVRGAWGLARLVPLPREDLLSFYHDLAQSRLAYMPDHQQAELEAKLALLRDAAVRARHLSSGGGGGGAVVVVAQQAIQAAAAVEQEGLEAGVAVAAAAAAWQRRGELVVAGGGCDGGATAGRR